ncbi:error-prone DNA polymerase [Sphingomonas montanisoli]|uniref:Error-prone DNA polymerase n=1 Tax=Sphingomonas montanisoli TaxID=2606412 RepID=A0A5D9C8K3_9SPHN|nr:error-prone DNA polymerase [Sphingomonas montanisoli]TZG27420.1 DNA polymerase III subunit alpha [Sphingomonas montanisoli]
MTRFAEMVAATNYSFLRGASPPSDMVGAALGLGLAGLGIADRNTVAGVVRAWDALRKARVEAEAAGEAFVPFKLVSGARLVFCDGTPDIVAYPATRHGWGRLCRLLTTGNRRAIKGDCILRFGDLLDHLDDLLLIVMPTGTFLREGEEGARPLPPKKEAEAQEPRARLSLVRPPVNFDRTPQEAVEETLARLAHHAPRRVWLGATIPYGGRDRRRLSRLATIARDAGVPLLATCDALYATPDQRPLHDVVTCIREGVKLADAGTKIAANAERHLKPEAEMDRLFRDCPQAVDEGAKLLDRIEWDIGSLKYEYPHEPVPEGWTPQRWLIHLVMEGARDRYPKFTKAHRDLIRTEIKLVGRVKYAYYFLTVHDVVAFARGQKILCQGRGSAANSVICYTLGITSIDPVHNKLLFSRFISEDRNEPPDIDVDFEHERREEVMQYIFDRYGRHRAGIAATVIHYRPRSTVREVGKVLGLSEDITARVSSTVWGSYAAKMEESRYAQAGLDLGNEEIGRLGMLVAQLLEYPRHLSQHVGGFVLTERRLDELVPIHNAAMDDRTFIEWDKDDIDALGLMKVDILALGMLTCIRKAFDLIGRHGMHPGYELHTIPADQPDVYDMLCAGDSIGVFQVESRAQINMLPRLRPRNLYDLAVQVAIVRPGPIQGGMVHPYLKRRKEQRQPNPPPITYPAPSAKHGRADELEEVLGKTLGVPLFQEQAMKLAIVAAKFTDARANQLRRAMATFRNVGTMPEFETEMIEGMVGRGYPRDFATACFAQIKGFGSYGFPESHAQSFALLVYVSSYIKCRYPAAFACALLNSQPMGFYAPAQIIDDARQHGVDLFEADINASFWDNSLESVGNMLALRIGLRQVDGFREDWANSIAEARAMRPFTTVEELARRAGLPGRAMRLLADADAFRSIGLDRRKALWEVRRLPTGALPLFDFARAAELGVEPDMALPEMPLSEEVAADYQVTRLSLKGHPMQFLRGMFAGEGVLSCKQVDQAKNGRRARVAGVVLVRQRPGEGKAIFITLEDETGIVNVLLWARIFEAQRAQVMSARLMEVEGEIQRSPEGVVHLMGATVIDRTAELARLSEDHQPTIELSRADVFAHPQLSRHAVPRGRHPRDVRILPPSRDFH